MKICKFIDGKRGRKAMKINKRSRTGIIIQIVAIITMVLLVLFNRAIPSVLVWVLNAGIIIALVGALMELSKRKKHKARL